MARRGSSADPGRGGEVLSRGFAPVSAPDARVLILGSLPGRRSLEERCYYAQPRNAFWDIMGALCGAGRELAYEQRLARLRAAGIALWDVLAAGQRPGSLDSAIVPATIVANDLNGFLCRHARIRLVCFNGVKAAELYRRTVLPTLDRAHAGLRYHTLPSSSPANATVRYPEKLRRWAQALGDFGRAATI